MIVDKKKKKSTGEADEESRYYVYMSSRPLCMLCRYVDIISLMQYLIYREYFSIVFDIILYHYQVVTWTCSSNLYKLYDTYVG